MKKNSDKISSAKLSSLDIFFPALKKNNGGNLKSGVRFCSVTQLYKVLIINEMLIINEVLIINEGYKPSKCL